MSEFPVPHATNDRTPGQLSLTNTKTGQPTSAFEIWPPSGDPDDKAPSVMDDNGVVGGNGGPSTYTLPVSLTRNQATAAEDAFNGGVIGVGNSLGSTALTGYAEAEAAQTAVIMTDIQKAGETGILG